LLEGQESISTKTRKGFEQEREISGRTADDDGMGWMMTLGREERCVYDKPGSDPLPSPQQKEGRGA
jgi:hypothetical protein